MATKILLDTDIGTDIDDAVCLAYLLANPDCELVGITTVTGESKQRARMASAMCRVAGRDIPIFPGAERPLLVEQRQCTAAQAGALHKWQHADAFPQPGEAVQFMRNTIRENPCEITLLTIGPLTNTALLFAMDPEIPSLLKGLVMMCGRFTSSAPNLPLVEWNARVDPHATAVMYRHAVAQHRSIGLDVTTQVTMAAEQVRNSFQAPLLKPVLDFAEIWFEERNTITFHDPLAAATIFNDTICQFTRGQVDVELQSERLAGMTHWTEETSGGRHEVATKVNSREFFDHFFSMF